MGRPPSPRHSTANTLSRSIPTAGSPPLRTARANAWAPPIPRLPPLYQRAPPPSPNPHIHSGQAHASTLAKRTHPLWPSARIHLGQAHGQRGRAPSLNSPIRAPSRTSRPPLHPPKKPPSAFYAGVSERSPDHRSESPRHRHSPRHLQPCRRFPPSTCAAVTSATLPPIAPPPSAGSLR